MTEAGARSSLRCLLFTDLVGSTALKTRLGDDAAGDLIARHHAHVRRLIGETAGREIDCTGDGFFVSFEAPSRAVSFALRLQQAHRAERDLPAVRIGIHMGEVTERPAPPGSSKPTLVEGLAVDLASRIASLAVAGQVLMSSPVFAAARQRLPAEGLNEEVTWCVHGPYHFKGIDEAIEIHEAGFARPSPLSAPPDSEKGRRALTAATPRKASIAVLPFANMSADAENEYFSDGLAEEIINELTHIPGLKVIARTSAFAFKGKHEDIRQIAEKLDVSNILEGSVRKAGSRIRVTVQLVSAADGSHLWSERYDREMADVFALQDEIAQAIAKALKLTLAEKPVARQRYIPSVPAYEAYLKARYLGRQLTLDGAARSKEYAEQAVALDPGWALARSNLGHYYLVTYAVGVLPAHEAFRLLRMHVQQALELDPDLPEAHSLMGVAAAFFEYDWAEADRRFRLAFAHEPVPTGVRLDRIIYFLQHVGRAREAVEDSERLLKQDPLYVHSIWAYATSLRAAGRDREADARYAQVMEFGQGFWSVSAAIALSGSHVERGAIPEALEYAEAAYASALRLPAAIGQLAGMLAHVGGLERSAALVAQLRPGESYGAPFGLALYYLAAGDIDQAADWLEKAIEQRDIWVPLLLMAGTMGGRVIWSSPRWPKLAKLLNVPVTRNWTR